MREIILVANWKANKTFEEASEWLEKIGTIRNVKNIRVVVCAPFIFLPFLKEKLARTNYPLPLVLGAQNVSPFDNGPYTGEITARMLSGIVKYVLIGHSERRRYFGETTKSVAEKLKMAITFGIASIVCGQSLEEIPDNLNNFDPSLYLLMYEPEESISVNGKYRPSDCENIRKTINLFKKERNLKCRFLYGGSVNPDNVGRFLAQCEIDGFVVGHASLNPETFGKIIQNIHQALYYKPCLIIKD